MIFRVTELTKDVTIDVQNSNAQKSKIEIDEYLMHTYSVITYIENSSY